MTETPHTEPAKLLGSEALKDLRAKILSGKEPTDEEVSLVLATLRGERAKIGVGKASSSKKARQPIDLGALFKKDGEGEKK